MNHFNAVSGNTEALVHTDIKGGMSDTSVNNTDSNLAAEPYYKEYREMKNLYLQEKLKQAGGNNDILAKINELLLDTEMPSNLNGGDMNTNPILSKIHELLLDTEMPSNFNGGVNKLNNKPVFWQN